MRKLDHLIYDVIKSGQLLICKFHYNDLLFKTVSDPDLPIGLLAKERRIHLEAYGAVKTPSAVELSAPAAKGTSRPASVPVP